MNSVVAVCRALDFAAQKHVDQRRKGARAEPYLNHLAEVARLLADATDGDDTALVIAGLLHDTIEDTDTTREALAALFGADVASLVAEVTDDRRLPRHERKRLQIIQAPHKSDRSKLIKIADKTSNLRALATSPPAEWSRERLRDYYAWASAVVAGCRGVNQRLEDWFDEAHRNGLSQLERSEPALP